MQFEWNGHTFKTEFDLFQAIYAQHEQELGNKSTEDAVGEILSAIGESPNSKDAFGVKRRASVTRAVDSYRASGNPFYVGQSTLEVARQHHKASAAALKGDKSDYARGWRRAEAAFMRYLEELNKGRTIKEAEDAVS